MSRRVSASPTTRLVCTESPAILAAPHPRRFQPAENRKSGLPIEPSFSQIWLRLKMRFTGSRLPALSVKLFTETPRGKSAPPTSGVNTPVRNYPRRRDSAPAYWPHPLCPEHPRRVKHLPLISEPSMHVAAHPARRSTRLVRADASAATQLTIFPNPS